MTPAERAAAGAAFDDLLDEYLGPDPDGPRDRPFLPAYNPEPAPGLTLLSRADLANIPARQYLVNGLLSLDSLAWLVGHPGSYKSFLAIDIAMSVATGTSFYGRRVEQRPTVYVTGEGRSGLNARVQAWGQHDAPDVTFWHPEGIHCQSDWWAMLVQACKDRNAGLIVLDTQSNMTYGMDENSAQEMSVWVKALQRLQNASGACVLTVHHTNKSGLAMRGSSVMHGAADTVIGMERHSEDPYSPCRVYTPKQKDLPQVDPWWVCPQSAGESIVLVETTEPACRS